MEFKEFSNPLSSDYDIKFSYEEENGHNVKENSGNTKDNFIKSKFSELYFDLGCPEVFELESYGISFDEFDNPTEETIQKIQNYAKDLSKKNKTR